MKNEKKAHPPATIDAQARSKIRLDPKLLRVYKRLDSKDVKKMWIERPLTHEARKNSLKETRVEARKNMLEEFLH